MGKLLKRLSVLVVCTALIMGDYAISVFAEEVQSEEAVAVIEEDVTEIEDEVEETTEEVVLNEANQEEEIVTEAVESEEEMYDEASLSGANSFSERTSCPDTSNAYYFSSSNPFYPDYAPNPGTIDSNGNCTWYAWGRAYEILGSRPNLWTGWASGWYSNNINNSWYSYNSSTPKLGAIACWSNHVAVVERINSNGTIMISESSYTVTNVHSGIRFRTRDNLSASSPDNYGDTFYGYIYIGDFNTNQDPTGDVRSVTCKKGMLYVEGWTYDPDETSKSISYHVYANGTCVYQGTADKESIDVDNAYHAGKNHRFEDYIPIPSGSYEIRVYAINNKSGNNPFLINHASGSSTWNVNINKSGLTSPIPDGEYHILSYVDTSYRVNCASQGTPKNLDNIELAYIEKNDAINDKAFSLRNKGDGYYMISLGNLAFDVDGAKKQSGVNVQMYSSNDSDAQRWFIRKADDFVSTGTYHITSKCNGFNLDAHGGGTVKNGSNIGTNEAHTGTNQRWRFLPVGKQTIPNGKYYISSAKDNSYCLTRSDNVVNSSIALAKVGNGGKQVFDVTYRGDGYYEIGYGGNSIDVKGASKALKTSISMYTSNSTAAQRWVLKDAGDGSYYIYSKCNALVIDLSNGDVNNGITDMYSYLGLINQKWKFIPYVSSECKVTFDGCGGTTEKKEMMASSNEPIGMLPNATRDGYSFAGWYTQPEGKGTKFTSETTVSQDITLYAYWTWKKYTVTFDSQGGSAVAAIENVQDGETIDLPTTAKGDMIFSGWYTEPNGQGTRYFNSTPILSDITLYAYWVTPLDLQIVGLEPQYTYTGKAIEPEMKVYDGSKELVLNQDYTYSLKNGVNVGTATITIKGKGNYASTETASFEIVARPISGFDFAAEDMLLKSTGRDQKPKPVLTWDGKTVSAKMYTYAYYRANAEGQPEGEALAAVKEAGNYVIVITGKTNFTGTRNVQLTVIEQTPVSTLSVAVKSQSYTGSAVKPAVTVKAGRTVLTKGVDYTVSYENNTNVGTAYAIITGIGQYSGTKKVVFQITGTPITKATINGVPASMVYSGTETKPDGYTLFVKATKTTPQTNLTEGIDYEVSYEKNANVGTAYIVFTGKGGYTGVLKRAFKITPIAVSDSDGKTTIVSDFSVAYSKGGAKLPLTVKYGETTLTENVDYTLKYSGNTAVNDLSNPKKKPSVLITFKGNYSGKITKNYAITPKLISAVAATAVDVVYPNKKNNFKTTFTITDTDGKVLKAGTDYDAVNAIYTYKEQTNVLNDGEALIRNAGDVVDSKDTIPVRTVIKVQIKGKGNYLDSSNPDAYIETEYRLVKANIASAGVTVPVQIYTGKEIKPTASEITVKMGRSDTLTEGVDYEIVGYSNNIMTGTATITIKGIGNYGGIKVQKFTIKAKTFKWWR